MRLKGCFNLYILISLLLHLLALALLLRLVSVEERTPSAPYLVSIVRPEDRASPETMPVPPSPRTAVRPEDDAIPLGEAPGEGRGRSRLFDREVLEGAIKGTGAEGGGERGITFSSAEMKYTGYMRLLKDKIEGIWNYPVEAAREGVYGDLLIRFVIRKDGTLGSVRVIRTSGYSVLDEAALKALREGEPYWPLPEGWGRNALTVTGRFVYTLYGVYVR